MSSAENFEDIVNEWRNIATELSIPKSVENRIERNIKYEPAFTATAIMGEILRSWRLSKSKAATLNVLLDALDKYNLKELSNKLRMTFKVPEHTGAQTPLNIRQDINKDPYNSRKVAAWLLTLLLAGYYVQTSDIQVAIPFPQKLIERLTKRNPIVKWSVKFCGKAVVLLIQTMIDQYDKHC